MLILGLGSNLGDRLNNLRKAFTLLKKIPHLKILKASPVYESDALLPPGGPAAWQQPFLNSAIICECSLEPEQLLSKIKKVEKLIGKPTNYKRWSPRLIDIDILVWDNKVHRNNILHIPQRDLCQRPFAMWPVADLSPNWHYNIPDEEHHGKTAKEIVEQWGSRFNGTDSLKTRQISHRIDCSKIVGVINVTPDSFSDGGKYTTPTLALEQSKKLFKDGADVIDIGAESTRPGNTKPLTPKEEWKRLQPILETICNYWNDKQFKPQISVDTRHAEVAKLALNYKIDWINDVAGFTDKTMCETVAPKNVKLAFMHSLSIPPKKDVTLDPKKDIITQLTKWANDKISELEKFGINKERLIFDPGIGFGKSAAQSFTIIKEVERLKELNLPILIGHSRKSFLSLFTEEPFENRDIESAAIADFLNRSEVDYIRVHNVEHIMRTLKIGQALK